MKIVSANSIRAIVAPALVAASLFAAGSAAQAQTAAPTGVRGTVTALSGDVLKVHTRDGKDVDVKLAKDTPIRGVALANVNDIKPDSYVGTASVPQPDGTAKALEVAVFDNALRGVGDGSYPWDMPGSTMTNGAVGDLVVSNGRIMTVKYKGGEKKIFVPADVPIVLVAPGDNSKVAVGTHVMAVTIKGDDGKLKAAFVLAGQNGLVPPM
jgi:hypothetical protein